MSTISLCMIVRDEAEVLERCLESVRDLVDEIVIADTGSVDRTKEIAAAFTDRIYDYKWEDDFSAARNFAFSQATGEYLLWMDADDIFPASEKRKFYDLKKELEQKPCDVVMMIYDTGFDENGKAVFSYYRERLIRNCTKARWQGRVHEAVQPFGEVRWEDIHFEHRKKKEDFSDRNLRIYEKMIGEGQKLEPREQFYYGRELYDHERYEEAERIFEQFLREPAAWLENRLDAVRLRASCLRVLQREEESLDCLLSALRLVPPTGEHCCDIGWYFFCREEWENAVFWYENALHAENRKEKGAFVQEECYGYIPCIQLCVCFDRLGDRKRAEMYNEMAGVLNPASEAVEKNRVYFSGKEKSSFIPE